IFATTEPDKLIATIRSRTHHYPFRLVPPGILQDHLQKVCGAEGTKVEKGVLPLVVRASGGSVRDALSVLGQLLAGAEKNSVSYEIAVQLLGFTDTSLLDDAIDAIAAHDLGSILKTIDRLIESGLDPRRFAQDLLELLRDLVIANVVNEDIKQILRNYPEDQLKKMQSQAQLIGAATLSRAAAIVAEGLNQMRGATAPRLILELIVSRILISGGDGSDQGLVARIERLERQAKMDPMPQIPSKPAPKPEVKKEREIAESKSNVDITFLRRMWPEVIESVKKKRRLTWSLLSTSAQILAVDEQKIIIGILNAGARDSFIRSESEGILSDAFVEVAGVRRIIEVVVDPTAGQVTGNTSISKSDEELSDQNQLGGAELIMKELGAQVISESEK
ncbi:MAG: DNA polymerase III subunit gamma/tau, partial [Actinomycetota bacterium]